MRVSWIERQIDDVLLATAVSTSFLYARRRTRRAVRRLTRGAAVVGAGAALTAAGAAGVGMAGATVLRRRRQAGKPIT